MARIIAKLVSALLVCLALMPIAPAYAANWIYVIEDVKGTVFYYDADTIQRSGNQVTVWEKWDHSRNRTIKEREDKVLNRYYCLERTFTILNWVGYYPDGTNKSFTWGTYQQTADPIVPETSGELMFKAVCR